MQMTLPPAPVQWLLLTLVLAAAVYDVRYRRIPNWLTVSGLVLGLALNTFIGRNPPDAVPYGWPGLLFSLKGFGLAFAANLVLYALHARSGGDVKLMAAIGAIVGWRIWVGIFIVSAIVGGVMALILVLLRGRLRTTMWNVSYIFSEMKRGRPAYLGKEELDVRSEKAMRLPAGAVIAIGVLFYLAAAIRLMD